MKLVWIREYKITDEELDRNVINFEKEYNIVLPDTYKEVLRKKRTSGLAREAMIKGYIEPYERIEMYWNGFDSSGEDLFKTNRISDDVRPDRIIFFAYDSGGNCYGFDFKDNPNDPKIVYYNHELVPPKGDLIADGFEGDEIEEEQRKCYKTVYDNFEDLYKHLEIGQKYWIEEEFGGEETEAFKNYLNKFNWTY